MQPGLSLDEIIARKRAQVKAKKSGKIIAPVEEEKEVNEDDESGELISNVLSWGSLSFRDIA